MELNDRKLSTLEPGDEFLFGGYHWTALEHDTDGGTLAISGDIVCSMAFDYNRSANWCKSSLRKWLNSPDGFIGELRRENYDDYNHDPFLKITSDLTYDYDGTNDYGIAEDEIALLSCGLYRRYIDIIPSVKETYWTLTADQRDSSAYFVRCVMWTGEICSPIVQDFERGVRPICRLKSDIEVQMTGSMAYRVLRVERIYISPFRDRKVNQETRKQLK
jgi:hypothetical protein